MPDDPARRGFERQLIRLLAEVHLVANRLKSGPTETDMFASGGLAVLRALAGHGPQTVPQIARVRSTSRQSAQVAVNRLAAADLVELAGNPAHKRSPLVRLTAWGQARLEAITQAEMARMKAFLPGVSEAEVMSATTLMRRIRDWLAVTGEPSRVGGGKPPPRPVARKVHRVVVRRQPAKTTAEAASLEIPAKAESVESNPQELPVSLL